METTFAPDGGVYAAGYCNFFTVSALSGTAIHMQLYTTLSMDTSPITLNDTAVHGKGC
jgi:hypothetical protein